MITHWNQTLKAYKKNAKITFSRLDNYLPFMKVHVFWQNWLIKNRSSDKLSISIFQGIQKASSMLQTQKKIMKVATQCTNLSYYCSYCILKLVHVCEAGCTRSYECNAFVQFKCTYLIKSYSVACCSKKKQYCPQNLMPSP